MKLGFGRDGAHTFILPVPGEHGEVGHLVLMHPEIDETLDISDRIRTLGEKYEQIKNHASEYIDWDDSYLGKISMVDLMMLSDEEIADERVVPLAKKKATLSGSSSS